MSPVSPSTTPRTDASPPAAEERRRITITADAAGQRLDRALAVALPEFSRSRLQALIAEGMVTVDGAASRDASAKMKAGMAVELGVPPPVAATPAAQSIPLVIVYEDADLLVIDKPAGMVVHPAAGNPDGTLVNALLAYCGAELSGIGGVARPGIVHRLDKDTSGLMVVAKNDTAHKALSAQFADRSLSREYVAVTIGRPSPSDGTIEGAIGRDPRDRKRMAIVATGGKQAITHYRVVTASIDAALVACRLATGRTHQIRVHLASIGHPLVGDALYGRRRGGGLPVAMQQFPRQALHARKLQFNHPRTGHERVFTTELPADMRGLLVDLFGRTHISD